MREIKFRAWDKENKCMIPEAKMYFEEFSIFSETEKDIQKLKQCADFRTIFFENLQKRFPLMQFTGLKDKNGKEIYENDLIEIKNNVDERIVEVIYKGSGFYIKSITDEKLESVRLDALVELGIVKVIGNVFENSDLLTTPPVIK